MPSEIENKVTETLERFHVTHGAQYAGQRKRDDWDCDAWIVWFNQDTPSHTETFDYFTGLGHRSPQPKPTDGGPAPRPNTLMWHELEAKRKPVAPHPAGVLSSLILDSAASGVSFEDWAAEFGHDTDSRKALETYLACQQNASKIRRVLGSGLVEELREILADY